LLTTGRALDRLQLPAFYVGRVQWDQWLLLKAIVMPGVSTVEVSAVVRDIPRLRTSSIVGSPLLGRDCWASKLEVLAAS